MQHLNFLQFAQLSGEAWKEAKEGSTIHIIIFLFIALFVVVIIKSAVQGVMDGRKENEEQRKRDARQQMTEEKPKISYSEAVKRAQEQKEKKDKQDEK